MEINTKLKDLELELHEALESGTVDTMPKEALEEKLKILEGEYMLEAERNNVSSGTEEKSLKEFDAIYQANIQKHILAATATMQLRNSSNRAALETLFYKK
jgi:hypothetical protein